MSFHQPVPLSLNPSPAYSQSQWNQTSPPTNIKTPNTRSEDRPCPGNSHTSAEMSSQICIDTPALLPWGTARSKGETPCGSPSSQSESPLPPATPSPQALTLPWPEQRAAERGGMGRGKWIPSALVSRRRREESQWLPSPRAWPGDGSSRGGRAAACRQL